MSSEVRLDNLSPTDPQPSRKKKFAINWLAVVGFGLVLGVLANFAWSSLRYQKAQTDLFAWTSQLQKDNPSIKFAGFKAGYSGDLLGMSYQYQGKYTTPTGHPIAIDFNFRGRPFADSSHLVLSAEGKSLTLPFADVERGRKLDLKAEFPEAFR
jgi:hypothetical protein